MEKLRWPYLHISAGGVKKILSFLILTVRYTLEMRFLVATECRFCQISKVG